jgi:hypothetical protein
MNFAELMELLDVDKDFVSEMRKRICFTDIQLKRMENSESHENRNEYLLKLLRKSSFATFRLFTQCMLHCQPHLVHYLDGNDGKSYICGRREEGIDTCVF